MTILKLKKVYHSKVSPLTIPQKIVYYEQTPIMPASPEYRHTLNTPCPLPRTCRPCVLRLDGVPV